MRQISTREKLLIGVTISVLVLILLYQFGAARIVESWNDVTVNLKKEKSRYEANVKRIKDRDSIYTRYNRVAHVTMKLENTDRPVRAVFSEYVASQYKKLGFGSPQIEPAKREEIEGVGDYEFLSLETKLTGKLDKIATLLNEFESQSLLVTELSMDLNERTGDISARIKVALIVKKEEQAEKKKRIQKKPGRPRRPMF